MRYIRIKEVVELTGLSRASIYRYMDEGGFPKQVSLGKRSVGWVDQELEAWLKERLTLRNLESQL
jgi:prophage regulatory protein